MDKIPLRNWHFKAEYIMKRAWLIFFLILIYLFIATNTRAQDFAPVGAEWYYNERFAFSGNVDYIKFTSEKDTVINGKTCKKIIKRHRIYCFNRPNTEFLYTSNDTVYFFDPSFNEFQNLYVFNSAPDDSWIIKIKDEEHKIDTITVSVDSISTKQINGQNLRTLHVTYKKNDENLDSYPSTIIEKIGDINYMFNWYLWSIVVCDANWTNGLRCYQDSDIGLYSTGIADSCDYVYVWTGIDHVEFLTPIEIFPNPAQDFVEIKIADLPNYSIELFDLNGNLLKSDETFDSNLKLDLSQIDNGVYVIILQHENQIIGSKRLIKE